MEKKNWLWIVIVCLAIVAVYQIIRLTGGNPADSPSPEIEPASQPDQRATHTASLAEMPGMLEEKKPPVIELANVEKPQEQSTATIASSAPNPEKQDTVEPAETAEAANTVETVAMQDSFSSVSGLPVEDTIQAPITTGPVVKSSNRGLVRGIVYSEDRGSALIDETLVQTGAVIDGVKVINIHAGGVEFENEGRQWTQKVGEAPDQQWR